MRDNRPGEAPSSKVCAPFSVPQTQPPHPSPTEGSHARGAALPLGRAARAQGGERAERKAERCDSACVAGPARPDVRGRSVLGPSRFPMFCRPLWLRLAEPAFPGRAFPATWQPLSSPRPTASVPYMRLCALPWSRTVSGVGVNR